MQLVHWNIIENNPYQTRQNYDGIEELAADIKQNREAMPETLGLLQVPLARQVKDEQGKVSYQLAFGHRRKRAFFHLWRESDMDPDWAVMPLTIANLTDQQMADYAWSENEKRRDISAIERAQAIERARADFGYSLTEIAERWGMSKSSASNTTRLLQLPEEVQELVQSGQLPERHARELLPLVQVMDLPKEAIKLARKAVAEEWNAETTRSYAVRALYNKGLSNLDKFNEFNDWGDLLPEGCLSLCTTDCPHFASLDKQPKCTNGALAEAKEVAYRQRLEQLASIKFHLPISREQEIPANALEIARSYNGGGCTNLSLGYKQWAYQAVPVGEDFPNIYYTCSEGYHCECRNGARDVQAEAKNPNHAKLQKWRGQQREKASKTIALLQQNLEIDFLNAFNQLNGQNRAFFVALLKQNGEQCNYDDVSSIAKAAANRTMYRNGWKASYDEYGKALLFAAQIKQLTRQVTPLEEVEAHLQILDDLIAEAELDNMSVSILPDSAAWQNSTERITEILNAHPGHDELRQRFAELQEKPEAPPEAEVEGLEVDLDAEDFEEEDLTQALISLRDGPTEGTVEPEAAVPAWLEEEPL